MIVAIVIAAALVAVAALLALVRVERGPSMLDRALGIELLASSLVGVIAIEAAWLRRTETIPILVALSLVGFVGSVVIARFAAREPDGETQVDDRPGADVDPVPASTSMNASAYGADGGPGADVEPGGGDAPVAEDPLDAAPHQAADDTGADDAGADETRPGASQEDRS